MNEYLEEFLERYENKPASHHLHKSLLTPLFKWLDENDLDLEKFSYKDLQNYLGIAPTSKPTKNYNKGTLEQIKNCFLRFLRWFIRQKVPDEDKGQNIKHQKRIERIKKDMVVPNNTGYVYKEGGERKALKREELEALLNKAKMRVKEDYYLFYTFAYTGMRSGELSPEMFIEVDSRQRKLKFKTEKHPDKPRTLFFSEKAWSIFEKLMQSKKIESTTNERNRLLKTHYRSLLPDEVELTTHAFRHSFETHMRNELGDKPLVKMLMGHFSGDVTDGYDETFSEEVKKAMTEDHYYNQLELPD